jgi:hypothetical protein
MKHTKYIVAGIVCALLAIGINADNTYSTENDPLVTLSYVEKIKDQILEELLAEIDINTLLESAKAQVNGNTDGNTKANIEYEVVEVFQGQKVMAASSCELILRSGKSNAVVTSDANKENSIGLSDITGGIELLHGDAVPVNHYIIVPRPDGRGIEITSATAYLMIRGEYEIVTE